MNTGVCLCAFISACPGLASPVTVGSCCGSCSGYGCRLSEAIGGSGGSSSSRVASLETDTHTHTRTHTANWHVSSGRTLQLTNICVKNYFKMTSVYQNIQLCIKTYSFYYTYRNKRVVYDMWMRTGGV